MTADVILVNVGGFALIGWIVWYFWLSHSQGVLADVSAGLQSALIVVKGGYTPDTIVVERGRPVRLIFRREESALCSERVVIPAFDKSALLPEGKEVSIEFVPTQKGEFPFACQMGMLRGRIVVD
ncbi:MAG TPA: cupredoxin domain-containing protein [Gemmatimonadales bacterium]|nr:cupredoxin domain-containing protein [Gemmatimonadales bacterium]